MVSNYPDDISVYWDKMFPEEPECPVCEALLVKDDVAPQIYCKECDWFVDLINE